MKRKYRGKTIWVSEIVRDDTPVFHDGWPMDRNAQVNWIYNLAADITFADMEGTPAEKVDWRLNQPDFDKPTWFHDQDDRDLLVFIVEESEREDNG